MSGPASVYREIQDEVGGVLVGNEDVVEQLTVALLTRGHVLVEGVPGVAKTTIARLFAGATGLEYTRIQLTPDTLPADITGTTVYREESAEFVVQKGPVFSNVVVADEINRATPKTQSALLEAMQERNVTIEGDTYELPDPFLVVATQNPLEMEGTFELPEAQRDRFMFKLNVGLPDRAQEMEILDRFDADPELSPSAVDPVVGPDDLRDARESVATVRVADAVKEYVLDIVDATRQAAGVEHGASPRASIMLQNAAKARAAIHERSYVRPDDVKALAEPLLAHRLVLSTDAELGGTETRDVVRDVLDTVAPPSVDIEPNDTTEAIGDGGNVDTANDGGP
ncbi:AAA family ATPase [Halorientalis litorea]|uniref:AAA family ATPase n=1 Tax=Halorientalis litorea TaxID=2931977 RepID=UPI001FF32130|nr:MoxR family ATPase [Halorientalis litorea]